MKKSQSYNMYHAIDIYDLHNENLAWTPIYVNLSNISTITTRKLDLELPEVYNGEELSDIQKLLRTSYTKEDITTISEKWLDLKLYDGMEITILSMNSGDEVVVVLSKDELSALINKP